MWRDRRPPYAEYPATDGIWLTIGAVLLAAGLLVWTVGQVAAILFGAHQPLPMPAEEMAGLLWNLPSHLDDPAQAWPRSVRGMLPGPLGMYAALVLVVWGPVLGLGLLVRACRPRARRERKARGSYKTHALVIPAILEWHGGLVATSIKPDVLRTTLAHRASLGEVWVYDPLALSGVPAAQWTPLAYCGTYAKAKRIGRMLADAADVQGHKPDDANYWQLLGAKLLACVLYAAADTGRTMADVARWVDVQDFDEVATCLGELGDEQALDAWAACISRPDNTRGSVFGTAETLLDVFGDPAVAESAEGCDLDVDALLTGANNTLYLYAPASEQERLRPLFELLVSVVISRSEELAAQQPDGMLSPRLFVCLDEAGNCAAIKKLPQLATTGRGQGIQLLTVWHDEAQLAYRYGRRAATVLNGHRAKLVLSGQADPASLELASKLVGDQAVMQVSETSGDGRNSETVSLGYRRLLPPEAVRQLKPKRALLIYGHLPPVRIRLRPWFHSPRLRKLANHPAPSRLPTSGTAPLQEPLAPIALPTPGGEGDEGVAA
jgi:type IV secretion system protein VirD4